MFNEILTGKASLDPKPEPQAPYRAPGEVPPVKLSCVSCNAMYAAPVGSPPGQCGNCRLAIVELNARNASIEFHAAEAESRRRENSHRIFGIVIAIVIAVGIGVFKYGMRSAKRDDFAQAAGYRDYDDYKQQSEESSLRPSDDYSAHIQSLARELCACKDLKCGREQMQSYVYYVRSHSAADEAAEKAAQQGTDDLYACMAKLEATP